MGLTLTEFIEARLAEDESAARAAGQVAEFDWTWHTEVPEGIDEPTDFVTGGGGALLADTMGGIEDIAPHIARHDPARVLREVEAKRRILAEHAEIYPAVAPVEPVRNDAVLDPDGVIVTFAYCVICDTEAPCPTILILASVWSDHPGYDPAWG